MIKINIFDKLKNLFKKNPKEFRKQNNIGITTPNCPYCNSVLDKFPQRKTKCKNCGNYIYVRTRSNDYKKVLIKKEEIDLIQQAWENKIHEPIKQNGIKVSEEKKEIPALDATNEYIKSKSELLDTYTKIQPYYPFMLLNNNEKKILLNCVYNYCGYHGIPKDIYKLFPSWNKKLLEFVCLMENSRLGNLIKFYFYEKQRHNDWWRLLGNKDSILCCFEDIKTLLYTNFFFYQSYNVISVRDLVPASSGVSSYVNGGLAHGETLIYYQGELYKITNKKEFEKFKENTNITLVWDWKQEMNKSILKKNNIPFDENKPLTEEEFVKLLRRYGVIKS